MIRRRLRAIAGPLLTLLLFAAAIVLLMREAEKISWDEFVVGLTGVPRLYLFFAALLITLNYCLLMTYDLLALRYIRRSLPIRRVALVGFLGYALGNNLGTLVAATPLRFRLYTSWGVPPRQVMAVVILLGLTFWSGVCWLGGVVLVLVPVPLPSDVRLPFTTQTIGAVLLSIGILYAAICTFWRRPLPIHSLRIRPPDPELMSLQASIASLDLAISATALYLVLPPDATVPFALVLAAYLVGIAASLLSQIPGGLVVLELILLKLLEDSVGKSVLGSLLIFRLMYYVIPLIIAAVVLAIYEFGSRKRRRPTRARARIKSPSLAIHFETRVLLPFLFRYDQLTELTRHYESIRIENRSIWRQEALDERYTDNVLPFLKLFNGEGGESTRGIYLPMDAEIERAVFPNQGRPGDHLPLKLVPRNGVEFFLRPYGTAVLSISLTSLESLAIGDIRKFNRDLHFGAPWLSRSRDRLPRLSIGLPDSAGQEYLPQLLRTLTGGALPGGTAAEAFQMLGSLYRDRLRREIMIEKWNDTGNEVQLHKDIVTFLDELGEQNISPTAAGRLKDEYLDVGSNKGIWKNPNKMKKNNKRAFNARKAELVMRIRQMLKSTEE